MAIDLPSLVKEDDAISYYRKALELFRKQNSFAQICLAIFQINNLPIKELCHISNHHIL